MFKISKILNNPKELILSAAKEIAYEESISKISMRKIASMCEIGVGTIYNYYPTKMDIIIDIIEDFWKDCLIDFKAKDFSNLDFFKELELFYFHILHYLDQFQSNFLKELTSLPTTNQVKTKSKEKESEFVNKILNVLEKIFYKHEMEFSQNAVESINKDSILGFILDYFFIMLRRHEQDFSFFKYILKKLLL